MAGLTDESLRWDKRHLAEGGYSCTATHLPTGLFVYRQYDDHTVLRSLWLEMRSELELKVEAAQGGFDYLFPLFDKFGGLWFEHEINGRAAKLQGEELAALREAYTAIGAKQQLQPLTDWIHQKATTAREKCLRRGAYLLLEVFEQLGKDGMIPFSDGKVRYVRKFAPRDWSQVPAQYQFLIALAEQYGIMVYEKGWDETLASIPAEARAEMQLVGEKLRNDKQVEAVQEWMSAQPEPNVQVTALDGLLQLLDNFGML